MKKLFLSPLRWAAGVLTLGLLLSGGAHASNNESTVATKDSGFTPLAKFGALLNSQVQNDYLQGNFEPGPTCGSTVFVSNDFFAGFNTNYVLRNDLGEFAYANMEYRNGYAFLTFYLFGSTHGSFVSVTSTSTGQVKEGEFGWVGGPCY